MDDSFGNRESYTYISVVGDSFAVRVKSEHDVWNGKKAVPREITDKKTGTKHVVYEICFNSINNVKLTDIQLKPSKIENFPPQWNIFCETKNGTRFVLQLSETSSIAKSFWLTIENAIIKEPMTLNIGSYQYNGATKYSISIIQNGNLIKRKYTQKEPNGLPAAVEIPKRGGKSEWNYDDQLDFILHNIYEAKIKPCFNSTDYYPQGVNNSPALITSTQQSTTPFFDEPPATYTDGDLPF